MNINAKFLSQRLVESLVLEILALKQSSAAFLSSPISLEPSFNDIPILWKRNGTSMTLIYTLNEYKGASNFAWNEDYHVGLSSSVLTSHGISIQTRLSQLVRRASGLGDQGRNPREHFDIETRLEEFRSATLSDTIYCSRYPNSPQHTLPFSDTYNKLLMGHYQWIPGNWLVFRNVNWIEKLNKLLSDLKNFVDTTKDIRRESIVRKLSLKLSINNNNYYISLAVNVNGDFKSVPFIRWMFCTNHAPMSATSIVGWHELLSGGMVKGSLKEVKLE